jgi:hypothetical protein
LFGPSALAKKGQIHLTNSSFANTASETVQQGHVSPVFALKYIIKNSPITTFDVSPFNADGTRRTDAEPTPAVKEESTKEGAKKKTVVQGPKSEAKRIQELLDQRKPPTEMLGSLCEQYNDDLDRIIEEFAK